MATVASMGEEKPTTEELPVEEKNEKEPVEKAEETPEEKPSDKADETVKPEEKKPEEKKEDHFNRRQRRLLQERSEFKAKAELYEKLMSQQQQQATQTGKPTRDAYADEGAYIEALTDWKMDQKLGTVRQELAQQSAQSQVMNEWSQKVTTARAVYADYDEVLAEATDIQLTGPVQEAIMDSKYGADIAYYMAQNPEDAQRIVSLSPTSAIREIGRIESYIEQEAKKNGGSSKKVPSPAPRPINPPKASSSGGASRDLEKMSPAEFAAYRNEQLRGKR